MILHPEAGHLRIVSASNRAYYPGLCLTVASALVFLPENIRPCVTVIHEGLREWHKKTFIKLLRHHGREPEVEFRGVTESGSPLPAAPGLHPLAYARLLAPALVREESFVYLDSDLLVLRDVSQLPGLLTRGNVLAAPVCGALGDDCPWLDPGRMNQADPYFCSGVMAVDNARWRSERVTERAFALAFREPENCKHYDQTVLNFLLHGQVDFADATWSWNHWRFDEMPDGPAILHYITGGKPWRAPSENGAGGLWLQAYEKICGRIFRRQRILMRLRAKASAACKRYQEKAATALPPVLMSKLAPRRLEEWKWSAKRSRDDRAPATRQKVADLLQQLESHLAPEPLRGSARQ